MIDPNSSKLPHHLTSEEAKENNLVGKKVAERAVSGGEIWPVFLVAPQNEYVNMGIHNIGDCSSCKILLWSWGKFVECPKCGEEHYIT